MDTSMTDTEVTEAEVVNYFAGQVMDTIRGDISRGDVPSTITCWADLHDHLDANGYAECVGMDCLSGPFVNAVEAECDRRIRAGELAGALTAGQRAHLVGCSRFPCESCMDYTARVMGVAR